MQRVDEVAHEALLNTDLVCVIMVHMHRFQALRASLVCRTWRTAFTTLDAQSPKPFRPRVLIACARCAIAAAHVFA